MAQAIASKQAQGASKRSGQALPTFAKLADLKRAFMNGQVTASAYEALLPTFAPKAQVPTATAIEAGSTFGKNETEASTHMVELAGIGSRPVRHSDAVWKAIFAARELVEAQYAGN